MVLAGSIQPLHPAAILPSPPRPSSPLYLTPTSPRTRHLQNGAPPNPFTSSNRRLIKTKINRAAAVVKFRRHPSFPPPSHRLSHIQRYPKHVWSPSGGWYAQPHNWKANTAVVAAVIAGIVVFTWKESAEREVRTRMPDPDRVFPSRRTSPTPAGIYRSTTDALCGDRLE